MFLAFSKNLHEDNNFLQKSERDLFQKSKDFDYIDKIYPTKLFLVNLNYCWFLQGTLTLGSSPLRHNFTEIKGNFQVRLLKRAKKWKLQITGAFTMHYLVQ